MPAGAAEDFVAKCREHKLDFVVFVRHASSAPLHEGAAKRSEKKKLSVVVPAAELVKFQASLAGVMKNSFTNLKKKVREKKDKKKALKPDA